MFTNLLCYKYHSLLNNHSWEVCVSHVGQTGILSCYLQVHCVQVLRQRSGFETAFRFVYGQDPQVLFVLVKGDKSQMRQCCKEVLPKPKDPELRARTTIQKALFTFFPSRKETDNTQILLVSCLETQRTKQGPGVGASSWWEFSVEEIYQLLFRFFTVYSTEWMRMWVNKHFHVA